MIRLGETEKVAFVAEIFAALGPLRGQRVPERLAAGQTSEDDRAGRDLGFALGGDRNLLAGRRCDLIAQHLGGDAIFGRRARFEEDGCRGDREDSFARRDLFGLRD